VAAYARRWAAEADDSHRMVVLFDDRQTAGVDGCHPAAVVAAVYGVAVLGDAVAAAVAMKYRAALR